MYNDTTVEAQSSLEQSEGPAKWLSVYGLCQMDQVVLKLA